MIDTRVDADPESIKSTQHETQLGAGVSALNLDHPLTADADLLGDGRLIKFELLAPVANDGT